MNIGNTSLGNLARLSSGIRLMRWSSYDTTGGNVDRWPVHAGETVTLGEMEGAGCVKHIWVTTREENNNLRRLTLKMFWDGETTPSVLCPIGDFFGLGHAKATYFQSLPLQASYRGLNCWFPMPYARGAKITVTNDSDEDSFLYFYIDYQQWDAPAADMGTFHANWRRELVTKKASPEGPDAMGRIQRLNNTGADNYLILDAEGKGHYVGCFLNIDTNETGWWGEGDDMFFIDGEPWPPRLHGTGTEDYFGGAWNYNQLSAPYATPYYGYHFKGNADYTGKHSQYRFHVEDPIYFERSLKSSVEHGHANDKQGDWTSTAFWYQVDRTTELPAIGSFEDRVPYSHGGLERWPGKSRQDLPVGD